jgi:Uma2 family endonuclease
LRPDPFASRPLCGIVLDEAKLAREPLWQKEPIVCNGNTIELVVEVVSTNWQDDYARKIEEYALLGIPEYWIIDYLGIGGNERMKIFNRNSLSTPFPTSYKRQCHFASETLESRLKQPASAVVAYHDVEHY